jgi:hypothetical protein
MYSLYRDLGRMHYEDMLRTARHDALVRQAEASQTTARRQAWQVRVLARCGEQLVAWGERLQAAASVGSAEAPGVTPDRCAESLA